MEFEKEVRCVDVCVFVNVSEMRLGRVGNPHKTMNKQQTKGKQQLMAKIMQMMGFTTYVHNTS